LSPFHVAIQAGRTDAMSGDRELCGDSSGRWRGYATFVVAIALDPLRTFTADHQLYC
jgi:hypothetical protein